MSPKGKQNELTDQNIEARWSNNFVSTIGSWDVMSHWFMSFLLNHPIICFLLSHLSIFSVFFSLSDTIKPIDLTKGDMCKPSNSQLSKSCHWRSVCEPVKLSNSLKKGWFHWKVHFCPKTRPNHRISLKVSRRPTRQCGDSSQRHLQQQLCWTLIQGPWWAVYPQQTTPSKKTKTTKLGNDEGTCRKKICNLKACLRFVNRSL